MTTKSFLRLKQILEIFPVSKSHWYEGIQKGIYPPPIKPTKNMSMWRESDITQLIEDMVKKAEGGI